jgi:hypothetical protein
MKANQVPLFLCASVLLIAAPGPLNAQTPGELLIVEALQEIAFSIDELKPAQACRAETTTVLKGIKFTAAHPTNQDTAKSAARRGIVDDAWEAADANCKEIDKADGVTECRVKKGNLDRDTDIEVKCEKAGDVFACDAKLVNDVTYICNT